MGCSFSVNKLHPFESEEEITKNKSNVISAIKKSFRRLGSREASPRLRQNSNWNGGVSINRSNNLLIKNDSVSRSFNIKPENYLTMITSRVSHGSSKKKSFFPPANRSPKSINKSSPRKSYHKTCAHCDISFDSKDAFNEHIRVSLIFV